MINIDLNLTATLCLAIVFYLFGDFIKNKVEFFDKFCIPSPVIGGLIFTIISSFLRLFNIVALNIPTNIVPFFMTVFFTILGLSASLKLIKKGGRLLFTYWILCGTLSVLQNIISVVMSKVTNINPLLGLMCGTISMEGGHGNAAAFGRVIEGLGVDGAVTVGLSAATLGVIIGGILGAPCARYLIEKYKLKPTQNLINNKFNNKNIIGISKPNKSSFKLKPLDFFEQFLVILLCINIGQLLTTLIYNKVGLVLPEVVGCMVVAAIFRNFNDSFKLISLNFDLLDFLSEIALGMFLVIALMSINLLDLANIAGPMLIIVFTQAIFAVFFTIFIAFRLLGKNFDAAVMVAGILGHGIGNTPNALANMNAISKKYGPSEKAQLIVPLVGAFLLDAFSLPCIIIFINLFK